MDLSYSFIIPVYNRPEEVKELLESLVKQDFKKDFEVVIIEDGSAVSSEEVVSVFRDKLNISYYFKPNSGPGDSRNFGMKKASGNYFLILDSDVILPSGYLTRVNHFLSQTFFDCFGGPDAAHENFSDLQKAINYAMTSVFTTGGIRGNKKSVGKFQPRSFNMGLSKKAFEASKGFGLLHPGEDPDLSLRLEKLGFSTVLIPDAFVFHKRRIDWNKFNLQVYKFGLVRPILNLWHPNSAKITYWFPSLFLCGFFFSLALAMLGIWIFLYIYAGYFLLIGIDAAVKNKSFYIGSIAIVATFIQFYGYGRGFLIAVWKLQILKISPEKAFPFLFFKKS
ncbi:MAG: glycosyltransferase [Gillisia sp.]